MTDEQIEQVDEDSPKRGRKAKADEVSSDDIKSLVKSVAQIADNQPKFRKLGIHETKFPTPWNPTGERRTLKMKPAAFFQNGARVNVAMLSDEEITLINQLKPGLYNKKKWQVVRKRDKSLHLHYPNATLEHRFDLNIQAGGQFAGMLKLIVTEQEAQEQRRKQGMDDDDEE